MDRSRLQLAFLAAAGSAVLLGGAFIFQAIGYAPCKMCYWQRYPHAVAILLGIALLIMPSRLLIYLGALSALATSAVGFFHAGVELKWWDGPSSCTGGGGGLGNLSGDALLATDVNDVLVMCDQVSWAFAGISMAGWNGLLSLGLAGLWFLAARKSS